MADAEGPKISFKLGGAPPPEVAAYFRDKNLRPAFRWTEVWGEEHAHAFTVAKATQVDVLKTIQDSLQRAIDGGVPYQAWAKALKPELEKAGWWGVKEMIDPATGAAKSVQLGSPRRLKTIYDANLRSARAAGQWERAQRTKAVLPYFVYELGPSMHHRPEHVAREGTIRPVDDSLWDSWYPPNGWGCKCWLRQITRFEATAAGGETAVDPTDVDTREFTRTRDDGSKESVRVPKGIDPGWATNPGKARSETLMRNLTDKLQAAGPAVAKAAIADLWSGPTARVLPSLSARVFAPVAVASPELKALTGAAASIVQVGSGEAAAKIAKHGSGPRALNPGDFGRVQAIADRGELVEERGSSRALVAEMEDGWWKLAVKSAAGGAELIVSTLFPISRRTADGLRKKARARAEGR